ncbi:MAG: alkaline phosphatase D family protein [Pseudomonadota bacterium]
MPFESITRRSALVGAAGLTVAACSGAEEQLAPLTAREGPFKHGVASGDPGQTSVMLWTALTLPGMNQVEMSLEIWEDGDREANVFQGSQVLPLRPGEIATPMKFLIDSLQPGRWYRYQFRVGDFTSPEGRTRTLPLTGTDPFTIAAFSCSNHPAGFFNAYRDAADRGDVDLVLHLGDYIYEYAVGGYASEDAERLSRVPEPPTEVVTEDDYQRRHSQYALDPDIQALKAAAPWIPIWDDHETANNAFATGAENHDPDEGEGDWITRRDAGLKAFYEWLPVRDRADRTERYGALRIGDLATLIFIETRLSARSPELEWSSFPVPAGADPDDPEVQAAIRQWRDEQVGDPVRELMGEDQYQLVTNALRQSVAAGHPWRIFANQVLMGRATAPDYTRVTPFWLRWGMQLSGGEVWDFAQRTRHNVPMTLDTWDGFPVQREALFQAAREANADFITLTGDSHNFWTIDLATDDGERVGVEFGVTSVTSPSDFEFVNAPGVDFGAYTVEANDHILHHNVYDKGYVMLRLTAEAARADFIKVSTIKSREFVSSLESSWRVEPANGGPVPPVERIS